MRILLATTNLHKIREFKEIFKPLAHIDLISLNEFPDYVQPPEDGETFLENAKIKAVHAAENLSAWVLADDSGLCVPVLGGAPGVYSRRYAGTEATDFDNCKKLLHEMLPYNGLQRSAYYVCALVLARPGGEVVKAVEGSCEGIILESGRGRNGFGYDPLFLKHDYQKTFAELDESTKNQISHRKRAFDKLAFYLESSRS